MPDTIARLNAALEGRYHSERQLGEGGMATVYLAHDLRHERRVALKVLKPELAVVVGAYRFLAEIKTTANLQHPHILPLFDSGEADSFLFYVMPYLEGESLGERLDREHQLPVGEAVQIAKNVAEALDYAHRQGVIHRDIKPANILLQEGKPVVSDFGIALAVGAAGAGRLTETGLSLGTPHYMSPEQATGDLSVGAATDIYALGCVLYEMLVGDPPHTGSTAQAILGKIVTGDADPVTKHRRSVPANVDGAVQKALQKVPADRFTAAQDFAEALEDHGFRYKAEAAGAQERSSRWKMIAVVSTVVAVLASTAAVWAFAELTNASARVMRHQITPIGVGMGRPVGTYLALAPDGSSMVYAVPDEGGQTWSLWLKAREAAQPTLLPGTEGAQNVVYSPDGEWIAFWAGGVLKRRPTGDGSTVTLAEDRGSGAEIGLGWLDDGTIVYEGPDLTLMRIPAAGGLVETVATYGEAGFGSLGWIGALPGSAGVLVTLCRASGCGLDVSLWVADFRADTTRMLLDGVLRGWYTPSGHLMYVRRDGAVFAAPFDLDALALTGPGIPLFDGVRVTSSTPELAVAWNGDVLYSEGEAVSAGRELVWVDRSGELEPVDPALDRARYETLALSPDDLRIAVTMAASGTGSFGRAQLWVKELPVGPMTRLTTDGGSTRQPVWAADGRTIAYITNEGGRSHARTILADGSSAGASGILLQRERPVFEVFFTPDGDGLLFREGDTAPGQADLGFVDLINDTVEAQLLASEFNERAVTLSPDGRWMAYTSDAPGRDEVFVRPFPEAQSRFQVSTSGGTNPVWSHGGRELFYIGGDGWLSVATYRADSTFIVESRERLFDATSYYGHAGGWRSFDVATDDERFLMITRRSGPIQASTEASYIYIQNFITELCERTRDC